MPGHWDRQAWVRLMSDRLTGEASARDRPRGRSQKGHAAKKGAASDLKRLEELLSGGASARHDSDLVSHQNVQNAPAQGPVSAGLQDLSGSDLSEAKRLYAEALKLGFTFESALKTLQEAAEAAREMTDRAVEKPRPQTTPTAGAPAQVITREMLSSSVPLALQTDGRQKYEFPDELFHDPEIKKREESIANKMKYKLRQKQLLTEEEVARGKLARAFLGQLRTRHQQPVQS